MFIHSFFVVNTILSDDSSPLSVLEFPHYTFASDDDPDKDTKKIADSSQTSSGSDPITISKAYRHASLLELSPSITNYPLFTRNPVPDSIRSYLSTPIQFNLIESLGTDETRDLDSPPKPSARPPVTHIFVPFLRPMLPYTQLAAETSSPESLSPPSPFVASLCSNSRFHSLLEHLFTELIQEDGLQYMLRMRKTPGRTEHTVAYQATKHLFTTPLSKQHSKSTSRQLTDSVYEHSTPPVLDASEKNLRVSSPSTTSVTSNSPSLSLETSTTDATRDDNTTMTHPIIPNDTPSTSSLSPSPSSPPPTLSTIPPSLSTSSSSSSSPPSSTATHIYLSLPPPLSVLLASSQALHAPRQKLTVLGRALTKHGSRCSVWPLPKKGGEPARNEAALKILQRIYSNAVWINVHSMVVCLSHLFNTRHFPPLFFICFFISSSFLLLFFSIMSLSLKFELQKAMECAGLQMVLSFVDFSNRLLSLVIVMDGSINILSPIRQFYTFFIIVRPSLLPIHIFFIFLFLL